MKRVTLKDGSSRVHITVPEMRALLEVGENFTQATKLLADAEPPYIYRHRREDQRGWLLPRTWDDAAAIHLRRAAQDLLREAGAVADPNEGLGKLGRVWW